MDKLPLMHLGLILMIVMKEYQVSCDDVKLEDCSSIIFKYKFEIKSIYLYEKQKSKKTLNIFINDKSSLQNSASFLGKLINKQKSSVNMIVFTIADNDFDKEIEINIQDKDDKWTDITKNLIFSKKNNCYTFKQTSSEVQIDGCYRVFLNVLQISHWESTYIYQILPDLKKSLLYFSSNASQKAISNYINLISSNKTHIYFDISQEDKLHIEININYQQGNENIDKFLSLNNDGCIQFDETRIVKTKFYPLRALLNQKLCMKMDYVIQTGFDESLIGLEVFLPEVKSKVSVCYFYRESHTNATHKVVCSNTSDLYSRISSSSYGEICLNKVLLQDRLYTFYWYLKVVEVNNKDNRHLSTFPFTIIISDSVDLETKIQNCDILIITPQQIYYPLDNLQIDIKDEQIYFCQRKSNNFKCGSVRGGIVNVKLSNETHVKLYKNKKINEINIKMTSNGIVSSKIIKIVYNEETQCYKIDPILKVVSVSHTPIILGVSVFMIINLFIIVILLIYYRKKGAEKK